MALNEVEADAHGYFKKTGLRMAHSFVLCVARGHVAGDSGFVADALATFAPSVFGYGLGGYARGFSRDRLGL